MQKNILCIARIYKLGGNVASTGVSFFMEKQTQSPLQSTSNSLFCIIVAVLVTINGLRTAQAIEPLKELRAADKTQWTVTIVKKDIAKPSDNEKAKQKETSNPKNSPNNALVQSIGAKDGGIYRVLNRYDDQTVEDWWIVSHYQIFKINGQDKVARLSSSQNRAWNLEESDFPELYWALGQLPELQDIEGKKMLVIKMDASKKPLTKRQQRDLEDLRQAGDTMAAAPQNSATGTMVLYVNPETRMPVRFEDIDRIYSYAYDKSPNLKTVIPEDIKNEIVEFETKLSELRRPPSAPKVRNRQKTSTDNNGS